MMMDDDDDHDGDHQPKTVIDNWVGNSSALVVAASRVWIFTNVWIGGGK